MEILELDAVAFTIDAAAGMVLSRLTATRRALIFEAGI